MLTKDCVLPFYRTDDLKDSIIDIDLLYQYNRTLNDDKVTWYALHYIALPLLEISLTLIRRKAFPSWLQLCPYGTPGICTEAYAHLCV